MSKPKIYRIHRLSKLSWYRTLAVMLPVVAMGIIVIAATRAAGAPIAFEPENGTLAGGASVVSVAGQSGTGAVKFAAAATPTPTPVGSCAAVQQHTPDGPDGLGGCWPGPNNTGPNAAENTMSAYTGGCTVNSPNVTIDSKIINCAPFTVGANAAGLIIKNSYLKGGVVQDSASASYTIQDSQLDNAVSRPACTSGTTCAAGKYACGDLNNGTVDCGISGSNFTVLRTEVLHTNRGAYCQSTCTIQDSYFHGTNLWPDGSDMAHASGVREEQYLTFTHNSFGCDYNGPFTNNEIGCSADLTGYPDFAPIMHNTIDSNLFLANPGNGFCAYGGGTAGKPYSGNATNATYQVFKNNVFQRGSTGICGSYGPVTDFISGRTGNIWTNNKYDNGAIVNPQ